MDSWTVMLKLMAIYVWRGCGVAKLLVVLVP
jgi:hypothetical protein